MKPKSAHELKITRRNAIKGGVSVASLATLGTGTTGAFAQGATSPAVAQPATDAASQTTQLQLTPAEARSIAEEAYVFGFAIVEHYKALWAYGVEPKSPKYGGINKLRNEAQLYGPKDTAVVSANNDTIYTSGMIDLRTEPMVLQVPDIADRYYSFMLVDMVTDNFAYVGSRATGTKAGAYALTGPGWKGQLPKGVTRIPSPSWIAFAIGRTGVSGDADLPNLRKVQAGYKLTPLSEYAGKPAPAAAPKIDFPAIVDTKTADAVTFIKYLNFLMQFEAFPAVEQPLLAKFARIGIGPGKPFEPAMYSPDVMKAIEEGINAGREKVHKQADNLGTKVNGWDISPPNAGEFGQDYITRSAAAWKYIYVNSAVEAMYPTANVDGDGKQLDGSNGRYVLKFAKGALPPVNFFWSLTLYDAKTQVPIENAINRYSIGDRTPGIVKAKDGSLTLYVQADKPAGKDAANWLPAPKAPFYVILRAYGPKPELLNGTYKLAPMTRVS